MVVFIGLLGFLGKSSLFDPSPIVESCLMGTPNDTSRSITNTPGLPISWWRLVRAPGGGSCSQIDGFC